MVYLPREDDRAGIGRPTRILTSYKYFCFTSSARRYTDGERAGTTGKYNQFAIRRPLWLGQVAVDFAAADVPSLGAAAGAADLGQGGATGTGRENDLVVVRRP